MNTEDIHEFFFFNLSYFFNYLIFNWLIIPSQIEGIKNVCLLNNNLLP